jgi:hypothetical protein
MVIMDSIKSTIKSILSYCKVSRFAITLHLNPFDWFYYFFRFTTKCDYNPGFICEIHGQLGPVELLIYIDDERW